MTKTMSRFEYTEEMRQRALKKIAERERRLDPDILLHDYMKVMFDAFLRRLRTASNQRQRSDDPTTPKR